MIRNVTLNDAVIITEIYNYYIKNSIATFDEEPVEIVYFESKIKEVTKRFSWYVFEKDNEVLGYAYANSWNTRSAYYKTAEVSVYLKPNIVNKGIGTSLYKKLINELKEQNYHVVIGGISLPNEASVRLHEKFGFEKVAHFKEVGYKFNKWVDVGYWQLTLNDKNK